MRKTVRVGAVDPRVPRAESVSVRIGSFRASGQQVNCRDFPLPNFVAECSSFRVVRARGRTQ